MIRVCFVCAGNICRSPVAEAVFRYQAAVAGISDLIQVESAGTAAYHIDEPPDSRCAAIARRKGYLLRGRARLVSTEDFERFDYVLAVDARNLELVQRMKPEDSHATVALFTEYCGAEGIPDPYFGGESAFQQVVELSEKACEGLIQHLIGVHRLDRKVG